MNKSVNIGGYGGVTRGWFAIVYCVALAVGLIAVVLSFIFGTEELRAAAGVIVVLGVIALTVARYVAARRQRSSQPAAVERIIDRRFEADQIDAPTITLNSPPDNPAHWRAPRSGSG